MPVDFGPHLSDRDGFPSFGSEEPVDPGPRGFRKEAARRSQGPATCPQGRLVSLPGRRVSDVLGETWEAEGELRLPFPSGRDPSGPRPSPRKGTAATARES